MVQLDIVQNVEKKHRPDLERQGSYIIYILAGSYSHAKKWAAAQFMTDDEWFSTLDLDELKRVFDFHVVILESASELSPILFERLFSLAHMRGRIGRQ